MTSRTLKMAVSGLGRMGTRHALNVLYNSPRAELVGVCDPRPAAQQWAKTNLIGVPVYETLEQCVRKSGAEAVLVSSHTGSHASNVYTALDAGKHVLCEKPISVDLQTSLEVVQAAERRSDLKTMIGFVRRFDESYRAAKAMIDNGQLGTVHIMKSATNDQYDPSGFFIEYSKESGGIWIDCGIHDIDLGRWMFDAANTSSLSNPLQPVRRVFAVGHNIRHPELANYQDVDNTIALVEFSNGSTLNFHLSRTTMHGHECSAEIIGTEGRVLVNPNPRLNRTEIRDVHGVRTLSTPTYYERFKQAFVTEVQEFVSCVLDDTPLPIIARDGLEATKIATAATESFRRGRPVEFNDQGNMIL